MNETLFEIARGIHAAGCDLTYRKYRIGAGDLVELKNFAREQLVGDDPSDDQPLAGEQLVNLVARMLLDAMSAQHEVDVRRTTEFPREAGAAGRISGS
jgi:hypothetical protein